MRFITSKPKSAIGLEVGSYSVRIAEISATNIPPLLTRFSEYPLPKGIIVDGEISEVDKVAEFLKNIWSIENIGSAKVVLGISNPKVLVRQIELPYMDDSALKGAINFQAQEYIPIMPEDLILDYKVVGEYVNEDGQKMMEVLLVGAHKEMVNKFCMAAEKAGIDVDVVYLASLAIVQSLITESQIPGAAPPAAVNAEAVTGKEEESKTPAKTKAKKNVEVVEVESAHESQQVIVNIGAEITSIVVVEKGIPRFARIMAFGGNDFTDAIVNVAGISYDEAEEIKFSIGLKSAEDLGKKDDKVKIAADVLRKEFLKFAQELKRSIEYYFGQDLGRLNMEKLIIAGGVSEMINIVEFLQTYLKTPVEKGRPLRQIQVSNSLAKIGDIDRHESALAVVIGLALRGLQDL